MKKHIQLCLMIISFMLSVYFVFTGCATPEMNNDKPSNNDDITLTTAVHETLKSGYNETKLQGIDAITVTDVVPCILFEYKGEKYFTDTDLISDPPNAICFKTVYQDQNYNIILKPRDIIPEPAYITALNNYLEDQKANLLYPDYFKVRLTNRGFDIICNKPYTGTKSSGDRALFYGTSPMVDQTRSGGVICFSVYDKVVESPIFYDNIPMFQSFCLAASLPAGSGLTDKTVVSSTVIEWPGLNYTTTITTTALDNTTDTALKTFLENTQALFYQKNPTSDVEFFLIVDGNALGFYEALRKQFPGIITAVNHAPVSTTPTPVVTTIPTIEPTIEPTVIPTIEPTAEPTTQPTVIPTADVTAGPTVAPTAYPTMPSTLDFSGYPDADNTGIIGAGLTEADLTRSGSMHISKDRVRMSYNSKLETIIKYNSTLGKWSVETSVPELVAMVTNNNIQGLAGGKVRIERLFVEDGVYIYEGADGVTVSKCKMIRGSYGVKCIAGATNIIIEWCTFTNELEPHPAYPGGYRYNADAMRKAILANNCIIRYCSINKYADGIYLLNNVVAEYNYIYDLYHYDPVWDNPASTEDSTHSDGLQTSGGGNYVIRYNTVYTLKKNASVMGSNSKALAFNVEMSNNVFMGGNYTFYFIVKANNGMQNINIVNNYFYHWDSRHVYYMSPEVNNINSKTLTFGDMESLKNESWDKLNLTADQWQFMADEYYSNMRSSTASQRSTRADTDDPSEEQIRIACQKRVEYMENFLAEYAKQGMSKDELEDWARDEERLIKEEFGLDDSYDLTINIGL